MDNQEKKEFVKNAIILKYYHYSELQKIRNQ